MRIDVRSVARNYDERLAIVPIVPGDGQRPNRKGIAGDYAFAIDEEAAIVRPVAEVARDAGFFVVREQRFLLPDSAGAARGNGISNQVGDQ